MGDDALGISRGVRGFLATEPGCIHSHAEVPREEIIHADAAAKREVDPEIRARG